MISQKFIYTETLTLCPSVDEMYQISVCWVKSNYAFCFGFLPKTLQNYYIFFKEQNFRSIISRFRCKIS